MSIEWNGDWAGVVGNSDGLLTITVSHADSQEEIVLPVVEAARFAQNILNTCEEETSKKPA